MASQKDIDELAGSIRLGIEERGVHVLSEEELAPILYREDAESDAEKRMHLENFARLYGFDVHLSAFLRVAIFRKIDESKAGAAGDTKA